MFETSVHGKAVAEGIREAPVCTDCHGEHTIAAIKAGDAFEYVIPPQTFKIENAVAVVSTSTKKDAAASFVSFISTTAGQEAVAAAGYRPADQTVLAAHAQQYPAPDKLWSIADLGGWPAVTSSLFDKSTGAITAIYSKVTR